MRIGLVVPGFSANAADWCIPALRHLVRALAATDDVRVITLRYPYTRGRYQIEGAEVTALGGGLSHARQTLELWRDGLQQLRAEHHSRPFDVLHAFWATESGLLATLAGRLLGVPTLVSLAGGELVGLRDVGYGDQRLAWERLKVAISLRLAHAVSAGSRLLADRAQRHVPAGRRVRLAPLGVDLSLFSPSASARASRPRLIHVAALTPVKDQRTLLHAFAALRQTGSDATLDIIGDGPLHAHLRQLADSVGISSSVCFRGEVDHARLPEVYRSGRAFVLSSRHEAQSMVALEAAACGAAVAGTRVGVLPELTEAVAPVGDVDALAATLAMTLAATDAGYAPDRARSVFGLEVCTDRFRSIYATLRAET